MNKKMWLFILLVSVGWVAVSGQAGVEQALALFSADSNIMVEYSEEGQAQLEEAIVLLKEALGIPARLDETNKETLMAFPINPEKKDLATKLSQAYYTLADVFFRREPNRVMETHIKGRNWGFKSLRMNPAFVVLEQQEGFLVAVRAETDLAALYWTKVNWMRIAELDMMAAVRGRIPPQAKVLAERTLELDASFMNYGPYRTLGAFWSGLPSDPISALFIGGLRQDFDKVLANLCRVVDEPEFCAAHTGFVSPTVGEYFENRVFFVKFYLIPLEHWAAAARILESVLEDPIGEIYILYNAFYHEVARELLKEVRGHL